MEITPFCISEPEMEMPTGADPSCYHAIDTAAMEGKMG
jgi:hypothetical protein